MNEIKATRVRHNHQNESDFPDDWYFGSIGRSEAENILNNKGLTEGLFLVRQSASSPGDYALSCVQKNSVVHYQIRRVGDEPFFTIDSNGPVIHGLDMLLKHLRVLSATDNSVIVLKEHCRCGSPPPDTRLHGKSNLLHRAIASDGHRIVQELLQSNNGLNVNARDERGRTALHLAIELDEQIYCQIVEQLIKLGANVNFRDSESITPLHLCAKLNKPNFAKLLLIKGKAKTFGQTIGDNWVALHFAAYFGNINVIKVLLECGAALHPRNCQNETPTDIAIQMNHFECIKLLDSYADKPPDYSVPQNQWLFKQLTNRSETNKLFEMTGLRDGSYLVRKSKTKLNAYVLAMAYNSKVYNFEIQNKNNNYFIDCGPYWQSLEHLISYHMVSTDGLPSRLRAPISSFIETSINDSLILCNTKNNNDLNWSEKSGSNENIKSILFIDSNELKMGRLIGTGEYGDVFKGIWMRANKVRALVAIKILRKREAQDVQIKRKIDNFLKEVEVMARLKHPNIIKLLGVCTGPALMMIQELAAMGSVLDFLIDHPKEVDVCHDIKLWSTQIAEGMRYLESRHFVHRDLAARNVLLASLQQIKISDFGLSRALKTDQHFYEASIWDRWPLKWYAPEALKYGQFTHASDVWSYGVVLWEMYSLGEQPYDGTENSQIISLIESGKRLSKPIHCTDMVFALISICWSFEPKNRPTFEEIVKIINTNDDSYESIRNELQSTIEM